MARVRFLGHFLLLLVGAVAFSGCYHFRLEPEAVAGVRMIVARPQADTLPIVVSLLRQDGFLVDRQPTGEVLLTGFRHFSTETGFGQPVEGRGYYYRLRVSSRQLGPDRTELILETAALQLKTTYVYESEGKVRTMTKEYPYEEYPGMFDLGVVQRELQRAKRLLEKSLITEPEAGKDAEKA